MKTPTERKMEEINRVLNKKKKPPKIVLEKNNYRSLDQTEFEKWVKVLGGK